MGTRYIRRFGLLALAVGFAVAVMAPLASAQTDYPTTSTTPTTTVCPVAFVVHAASGLPAQATNGTVEVCGTSVTNPPGVTVKAASVTTPSGSLAFTGGNIALLVGLGLVAAVGGVVLVRLGRRADVTR